MTESYVVILCGGSGTRLWPASRPSRPKQFAPILGEESLFLQTIRRAMPEHGARRLLVVAGHAHEAEIARQLASARIEGAVLIEPEGRDSGPAIAAAAAYVAGTAPDAVMFILASDHFIPDLDAFRTSLNVAEDAARTGLIATLGIMPTQPSTAYGYIRPSTRPVENQAAPILEFREKPDAERAREFVKDGYLWNSGNFVATASTLLAAFDAFEPDLAAAARDAVRSARFSGFGLHLGPRFHEAKRISVDFAVMERAANLCVIPVAWPWSDVGAWDAVRACLTPDEHGNVLTGDAVAWDTRDCLVRAEPGMVVATAGIRDLAVIVERDAVLVCRLEAAQSVKQVVDELKRRNHAAVDVPASAQSPSLSAQASELRNWLFNAALPLWWCAGADHARGGFRELIALDGTPVGDIRRCRVQSRQTYVYAQAGAMGWSGPWHAAVRHGFAELEASYRRADGLYRTLVSNDGEPLDDTATIYDQTFVLLALAAARHLTPDAEHRALAVLAQLETRRHPAGGYRESADEPFQSNPHMHLFEACLAWIEAGGNARWTDVAGEIAHQAQRRFIQAGTGALHEFFDADWNLAPGAAGQRIEPGHQFEWAWLLERWARLMGDEAAGAAALKLFDFGETGVDAARKLAVNAIGPDSSVLDPGARLWPQTERLKAAALLATRRDGDKTRFLGVALDSLASLRLYLDTPVRGLWRDKVAPDGRFIDEPAPASSFYHIIGAILAVQPRQPDRCLASTGKLPSASLLQEREAVSHNTIAPPVDRALARD